MVNKRTSLIEVGPVSYENWKAHEAKSTYYGSYEYPLYTDSHITGELRGELGPYQILNQVVIPRREYTGAFPALTLRVDFHLHEETVSADEMMAGTNVDRYHGGWLQDEIAALLSLCVGTRFQAGDRSRRFEPSGDVKGLPEATGYHKAPQLPKAITLNRILPNSGGSRNLRDAEIIRSFVYLSREAAVNLIRAARLYQDALWIADSQPQLSWILLASAIEPVAEFVYGQDLAIDRLRASKPDLANLLEREGGETLVEQVANHISQSLGATNKFVKFIIEFLPEPPEKRPKYSQFKWSKTNMRDALSRIYKWRSRALHSGIPFPDPMCRPPMIQDDSYFEIPSGLAASSFGGTWIAKDMPMHLHLFEYIVRNALLAWWASLSFERDEDK